MCGNALPAGQGIAKTREERAGRALKESRATAAESQPTGPFDPNGEATFGIHQIRGFTSTFIDWHTLTRYEIRGGSGHVCYHAGEVGGSAYDRGTRAPNRPWTIEVREIDGSPEGALTWRLVRPWRMFQHRVDAFDGEGNVLGCVESRFSLLRRRFDIVDLSGNTLAQVVGPWLSPWTFEIRVGGEVRGSVQKQWGGLGRELLSSADTFGLELDPSWDHALRGLVLAATFLIDFVHFEKSGAAIGIDIADAAS